MNNDGVSLTSNLHPESLETIEIEIPSQEEREAARQAALAGYELLVAMNTLWWTATAGRPMRPRRFQTPHKSYPVLSDALDKPKPKGLVWLDRDGT